MAGTHHPWRWVDRKEETELMEADGHPELHQLCCFILPFRPALAGCWTGGGHEALWLPAAQQVIGTSICSLSWEVRERTAFSKESSLPWGVSTKCSRIDGSSYNKIIDIKSTGNTITNWITLIITQNVYHGTEIQCPPPGRPAWSGYLPGGRHKEISWSFAFSSFESLKLNPPSSSCSPSIGQDLVLLFLISFLMWGVGQANPRPPSWAVLRP